MQRWGNDNSIVVAIAVSTVVKVLVDVWTAWFESNRARQLEQRSRFWAVLAQVCRHGGIDVVKLIQCLGRVLASLLSASNDGQP